MSQSDPQAVHPPQKSNKKVLFFIAIVLVVLSSKVVYDYIETSKLEEAHQAKILEVKALKVALDSIHIEVEEKIRTIEALGGAADTLHAIQKQLKEQYDQLEERSQSEIQELEEQLEGYSELLLLRMKRSRSSKQ